jgi:hypothetical protein
MTRALALPLDIHTGAYSKQALQQGGGNWGARRAKAWARAHMYVFYVLSLF